MALIQPVKLFTLVFLEKDKLNHTDILQKIKLEVTQKIEEGYQDPSEVWLQCFATNVIHFNCKIVKLLIKDRYELLLIIRDQLTEQP